MYSFARSLLFLFPPEDVHYFVMNALRTAYSIESFKNITRKKFSFNNTALQKKFFGLDFKNPVGLGAGFDKNALYIDELETLGFGFIEVGTVTPLPQSGNERPRLFRLAKDNALINRMGFNNDGVEKVAKRLYDWKLKTVKPTLVIGGNIGKNKATPNENAWKDYEICFKSLFDCVDYFVVNVSSPNTPGLRELQEKDSLKRILSHLQNINASKTIYKPLLLKIAPDLNKEQLDDIIALSFEINLDGLVATNTTISREFLKTNAQKINKIGAGGLSGKPLMERSTEVLRYLTEQLHSDIPVIASGGIFNGADAKEKFDAGASLVQVWTGFVYEGPSIAKNICRYLMETQTDHIKQN
ncbi:MAG TPA: quinone-dependent dihydroorotate dehydrogenase [Chitinophagaceae bacterium]